jgi:YidC/Oxa1 family membrane protein insertase
VGGFLEPGNDNAERRLLLATVLAILLLILYQFFFVPPPPEPPPAKGPEKEATKEAKAPPPSTPPPPAKARPPAGPLRRGEREEELTLETDLLRVILTTQGARVKSWQLKRYHDPGGGAVEMVGIPPEGGRVLPLTAGVQGGEGDRGIYRVVERPIFDPTKPQRVVMEFQEKSGLLIEKTVVLHPGRYLADLHLRLKNLGPGTIQAAVRLQWGPGFRLGAKDQPAQSVQPVAWIDGTRVTPDLTKAEQELTQPGTLSWTALQDTYFAVAFLPKGDNPSGLVGKDQDGRPFVGLLYPVANLPPGRETTAETQIYAGPKEIAKLRDAGSHLGELVDLGWFDFLVRPALYLLKFFFDLTGNYGVAIIIITILQKFAFYPLTHKSLKSMQEMQALQPKVQALREKYKNNPQKMNQEMMDLYKRHGVNPLGGCLPMLLQIPIFIALYNALANSVELWRAPFALWIDDLSAPDALFVVPFAIPFLGEAFPFRALPLIMGISMYIQQKMSPTGGDPRQAQMMLYLMPVMFTVMFWGFPSGLVLYWLINNVLQIGQQHLLNRRVFQPVQAEAETG